MKYSEIIKSKFSQESTENFIMILFRFKGKDFAQWYNMRNPNNSKEIKDILEKLNKQAMNTFKKYEVRKI